MFKIPKFTLPVLIVLLIIAFIFGASGFYSFQREKAINLALQGKLEQAETAQKQTEEKLTGAKKTISDLESKLQAANTEIQRLSGDLDQQKAVNSETSAQLEQTKADLEQQKNLRADLESRLSGAQEEAKKAQGQVSALQEKNNVLESKLKDLEVKNQSVELGTVIVNPESTVKAPVQKKESKKKAEPKKKAAPAKKEAVEKPKQPEVVPVATGFEGKVMVINKEYNFVVISLGSKDGIEVGSAFSVYHGDSYLGDVRIEKVHDSMSAAGFVSADLKDKVSEGDRVVRKEK